MSAMPREKSRGRGKKRKAPMSDEEAKVEEQATSEVDLCLLTQNSEGKFVPKFSKKLRACCNEANPLVRL